MSFRALTSFFLQGAIDGLAEGGSGIFDKLILGSAEHLWGANPHCGFKSSFLVRQTAPLSLLDNLAESLFSTHRALSKHYDKTG
jgi:hypothetical protein